MGRVLGPSRGPRLPLLGIIPLYSNDNTPSKTQAEVIAALRKQMGNLSKSNTMLKAGALKRRNESKRLAAQKRRMVGVDSVFDDGGMIDKSASEQLQKAALGFWSATTGGEHGCIGKDRRMDANLRNS